MFVTLPSRSFDEVRSRLMIVRQVEVTVKMWLRYRKLIRIVSTLFELIFLLDNIINVEIWKNHLVSELCKDQTQIQPSNISETHQAFHHKHTTYCPHLAQLLSPEEELEERNLLDLIAWPKPPSGSEALEFSQTSDPFHSHFSIGNGKNWFVGDQLEVNILMRDFKGRPKPYGGDLLLASLRSPKYGAGVAGQVLDHNNGHYSARFPLLWAGPARVKVTMVHSSEAVAVLRRLREQRPDRVHFSSIFGQGSRSEKTVCNMCLPPDQGPLCNFTDLHTGDPWFCYKPKNLSCYTRNSYVLEGSPDNIIDSNEAWLFRSGINLNVPIHADPSNDIIVLPSTNGTVDLQSHDFFEGGGGDSTQNPDHAKLATSGYYYKEVWRSLGGVTKRQFDSASIIQCLTNKSVYMYGDSTMRQWYEYLVTVIPGIQEIDEEGEVNVGPFRAMDLTHKIVLRFRFHGPPIVSRTAVMARKLRYIANELDGLTGGPDTVVALSLWADFAPFPLEMYLHRLRQIRKAVVRLLDRAPGTVIVIRTPNPRAQKRDLVLNFSDWFSLQMDTVLRAMFEGIDVLLVDAWQMCVAHHQPYDLHPPGVIVKNMVDMMLSYICPDLTGNESRQLKMWLNVIDLI
ncbi:NXPE family member 3-like [Syngnathus scovelli]|uniref:NXPE family member 3-like n=1 Tax=Syngnathus scovelli TaxID=161590 RepID=UPI0021103280|nr:NXPE family member 3-like [Syngnathus scovelli]